MTDVKEQWICIKFCFKLGNTEAETHKVLKEAFGDNAVGYINGLTVSRMNGYQSMKRFLDDL